jgi:hypothetical protein
MSQIDLYWLMANDPKGAPITGYKVEVSSDGGATWTTLAADTGSRATMYSHTGLTNRATRSYRVSAINSKGMTPPSPADMAMAGTETPPTLMAPTEVVASVLRNTVSVTWTKDPNAEQTKVVLFNADVTEIVEIETVNPANDDGSHTFTDLDAGTYYVVVASFRTGMKHVLSDLKMVTVQ